MKWTVESYDAKAYRLAKWHPWFAWYPVRLWDSDDDRDHWRWLCKVERSVMFCQGWRFSKYRDLGDHGVQWQHGWLPTIRSGFDSP